VPFRGESNQRSEKAVTTLSLLPGPLKRLFAKIDAAATSDSSLELALDRWRTKRGDRLLPSLSDMDMKQLGPLASHLFIFERCSKADWKMRFAGDAAKQLLGARASEPTLSGLENRRLAARLRLLFEWVEETGEAVSATFISPDQTGEILVAPLSGDGKTVGAVYGGVVSRHL
jgi:ribose-phosphate pyrophosphokinase